MGNEKAGLGQAILRFFKFWGKKNTGDAESAPEAPPVGMVDQISSAFDIQHQKMTDSYDKLKAAINEVEEILKAKEERLGKFATQKEELIQRREETLAKAEQAQNDNDLHTYETHSNEFDRIQERINQIDEARLAQAREIESTSDQLDKYKKQLKELKAHIDSLPAQKQAAISDYTSAKEAINRDMSNE